MIHLGTLQDILDADQSRREVNLPPHLAPEGKIFYMRLIDAMKSTGIHQASSEIIKESSIKT